MSEKPRNFKCLNNPKMPVVKTHTECKVEDDRSLGEKTMDTLNNVADSIKEALTPDPKDAGDNIATPALRHQYLPQEEPEENASFSSAVTALLTSGKHCFDHGPGSTSPKDAMQT